MSGAREHPRVASYCLQSWHINDVYQSSAIGSSRRAKGALLDKGRRARQASKLLLNFVIHPSISTKRVDIERTITTGHSTKGSKWYYYKSCQQSHLDDFIAPRTNSQVRSCQHLYPEQRARFEWRSAG